MPVPASETQRTTSEGSRRPVKITPSDSADLPTPVRGLHANSEGWIKVTGTDSDDGNSHELYLLKGVCYPYWVKRVWATPSQTPFADVVGLL